MKRLQDRRSLGWAVCLLTLVAAAAAVRPLTPNATADSTPSESIPPMNHALAEQGMSAEPEMGRFAAEVGPTFEASFNGVSAGFGLNDRERRKLALAREAVERAEVEFGEAQVDSGKDEALPASNRSPVLSIEEAEARKLARLRSRQSTDPNPFEIWSGTSTAPEVNR